MKLKGKCVGFDIGGCDIHIAVREGNRLTRVITEPLPEGIVRDGQIMSFEAMSDFLKDTRKRNKIHVADAAVVLPAPLCYSRRLTTTYMAHEQLLFNLPYEFRDFLSSGKEDYFYDYAVVDTVHDEEGQPVELDLMAAAVRKSLIHDYVAMFQRAGFHLRTAIPEELAYINLIRHGGARHGHCLLDIGHNAIRLYMFMGDKFENIRVIDFGCAALDQVIAEHFNVDVHVANTYRLTNHNDCTALPQCKEIYNAIAIEVLKAVNFYRFSNQGEEMDHLHCCGGGVKNKELIASLRNELSLDVVGMSEFWPGLHEQLADDVPLCAAAAGAVLQ